MSTEQQHIVSKPLQSIFAIRENDRAKVLLIPELERSDSSSSLDTLQSSTALGPDVESPISPMGKLDFHSHSLELSSETIHEHDMASPSDTMANSVTSIRTEPSSPTSPPHPERQRSVTFRPRVRITSGLHHHRSRPSRTPSSPQNSEDQVNISPVFTTQPMSIPIPRDTFGGSEDSSLSGSPSSSISAPLRKDDDEEHSRRPSSSRWAPLGQRVSALAGHSRRAKTVKRKQGRLYRAHLQNGERSPDERTSLLKSPGRRSWYFGRGLGDSTPDEEEDVDDETRRLRDEEYEKQYNSEIDAVFGPWPGRLLNRHWWWWHAEPVVKCKCLDDSDSESEQ